MKEQDHFRIEAALQFGFEAEDMGDRDDELYQCHESQLIAFAKSCELKGRKEAGELLQRASSVVGRQMQPFLQEYLDKNKILESELAPILEAEEAKFMTAQGYVRGTDEPGKRWVKP